MKTLLKLMSCSVFRKDLSSAHCSSYYIDVNDIINCSPYGEFILYADDTNIFVVADSKAEAFKKANKVLELVNSYMMSNLLHINTGKYNVISCISDQTCTHVAFAHALSRMIGKPSYFFRVLRSSRCLL